MSTGTKTRPGQNAIPSAKVFSVAADGNLVCVSTENRLVLIEESKIRSVFTPADGLPNHVVTRIAVDIKTDDVWGIITNSIEFEC